MIANPLQAPDNRLGILIPWAPSGTRVFKYATVTDTWTVNTYLFGAWQDDEMTLLPGEGALCRLPGPDPLALSFVGEVRQGYAVNPVDNGWAIRSSLIPQGGRVTSDLLLPVMTGGDVVRQLVAGSFVDFTFDNGVWSPSEPVIGVGESFWSYKNVGFWWSRNFLVWP
jgi:hypothetical protein